MEEIARKTSSFSAELVLFLNNKRVDGVDRLLLSIDRERERGEERERERERASERKRERERERGRLKTREGGEVLCVNIKSGPNEPQKQKETKQKKA